MDTLFGLPAHPFLVHVPIVLLPLAAAGLVVLVIKPAWHQRFRWAVLIVGGIGTIGAILGASAGEELVGRIVAVEGAQAASRWEDHAELGDTARNVAFVFFILLAAYILIPWWQERRACEASGQASDRAATTTSGGARWMRTGLAVLALVGAAASVTTIIQAGHTGSKSVWHDYVSKTSSDD